MISEDYTDKKVKLHNLNKESKTPIYFHMFAGLESHGNGMSSG